MIGNPRGSLVSRGLSALSYLLSVTFLLVRDRKRFDGVIATTNPPFIGLVAVVFRTLTGIPYVTIVHDVYPEIVSKLGVMDQHSLLYALWARATNVIFGHSAAVIAIGRDMEQVIRAKLSRKEQKKIRLIPNWSDERRIRPVPCESNTFASRHKLNGRFVVQYSGRMGRTHNLEPLLEAARLLRGEGILLQLIGDGAKRETLVSLAQEHGLDNVQFLPYQPLEQLDEVLSAADLAVVCLDRRFTGLSVPSKTYGIMASGRPILGFLDPAGEIAKTIVENDCGVILARPTGQQVAEVIKELMAHPEELARMGENGRRAFLQNYTLSRAVDQYDRLLRECFAGR